MSAKEEGAAILEQLRAMEAAADPGQHLPDGDKGDRHANQFPARYLEPDPADDIIHIKNQLATGARPVPITDDEINLLFRKAAAHETFKKDAWFQNTWHANSANPTMQRWAQTMYPEFFRRREQVIDEQTAIQNRLAKMKLYGVRDRTDFDLLFGIHQGVIEVDDKSIWNITGDALTKPRRGLFSPFRSNRHAKAESRFNSALPFTNFPKKGDTEQQNLPGPLQPSFMGYKGQA